MLILIGIIIILKISLDTDLLLCKDASCKSTDHKRKIDTLYDNIVNSLVQSSKDLVQIHKHSENHRPGWNDIYMEAYSQKREAILMWKDSGKPKHSPVFAIYNKARANFKYSLRYCKSQETATLSNKVAEEMSANDYDKFWNSMKRSSQNKNGLTSTIDGVVGDHNIAKMWGSHFQKLLNISVITSAKSFVTSKCANVGYSHDMQVTVEEVLKAIRFSKSVKAPDHYGVTSEHC